MQLCAFMQDDLISTAEAAEIVGKSIATINRWAAEGRLAATVQFPGPKGARLYKRSDVDRIAVELEPDGAAS